MQHREWRRERFDWPHLPTMICREERRYLHWLGRRAWTGRGHVVEIGPWLGGSTYCLAAGMTASGHDARGKLRVYDNFLWRAFMADRAVLPIQPGDSFEPFFRGNLRPYADVVDCRVRSLPDEEVPGDEEAAGKRYDPASGIAPFTWDPADPLEILFVDGAKSWRGLRRLLLEVHSSLIPGASLIACQDFKYWSTYWVPAIISRLRDHLEPVHNVLSGGTVAFRVRSPIARDELERLESSVSDVPTEAGLADLAGAAALLHEDGDRLGARTVELAQVGFLAHQGQLDRALSRFRELAAGWPGSAPLQLERARTYLEQRAGVDLRPFPPRGALARIRRLAQSLVQRR